MHVRTSVVHSGMRVLKALLCKALHVAGWQNRSSYHKDLMDCLLGNKICRYTIRTSLLIQIEQQPEQSVDLSIFTNIVGGALTQRETKRYTRCGTCVGALLIAVS